ncbi:Class I histocompatibility antigen, F10 alpha chain [Chelonia mydas]|uniref:Class I histocompatibility antigen, F10 alpha chain n=1 Tax=Chelonia mydas TaxID=8469 RepID=M7ASN6_CHEMY|nr:Class I histocompatibility antigen, F10 alpha chain [Chelonia mydas]
MMERGHDRDTLECRVKVKELRNAYLKEREANCRSVAVPTSCRYYTELDMILGGDPTSTTETTVDTSVAQGTIESGLNQKEEIVDGDMEGEGDPETEDDFVFTDACSQELFSTQEEASQSQQSEFGKAETGQEAPGRHSLNILVTGVIDEEGTNQYFMIAKLDDVKIAYYSSDTREVRTTQEWVAQAVGSDYLREKTQKFWRYEEGSKGHTRWWMQLHNQTGGFHTEQVHVGCALSGQALVDPRFQYAYDGRDFISFDDQTGTWVAAEQPAFPQKQS